MARGASRTTLNGPSAAPGGLSAQKGGIVSAEDALADFAAAVRLHTMRRGTIALKVLAADAGIDEGRLRDFLRADPDKRRHPTFAEVLSIWAAMTAADPLAGAAAAGRSLARAGLSADVEDAEPEPLAQAVVELLDEAGEVARAAAQGGVCRANAAALEHAGDKLVEQGKALRRAGREAGR